MRAVERVFHSVSFEVIAVTLSIAGLAAFTEHDIAALSGTMIVIASVAMVWNYAFNWVFDLYVKGDKTKRTFSMRLFHVILFEAGLLVLTIPIMAYLLSVSLWNAFLMDLGVTIFITIYAFLFNLSYDHIRAAIIQRRACNNQV
ncbi:PACE efflux transporter [Pseudoalteromonas nigrifaciens]|uniref:PACE efflux transporter n=1 Tax=Pseudoalteromonas nigrifaciens TaxID=28109 RepID=UPI001788426F|nr:PACE efflux transporter [Pseudoalteromonas nigrifaciens]MBE0422125.1 PACE efflux transporter [Pseudoalteromonas nigrifaciens]